MGLAGFFLRLLVLRDQQSGDPDTEIEKRKHGQDACGTEAVDHETKTGDCNNETDRSPDPDTAVLWRLVFQVMKGHNLDLGQYGIPEKTEERHRQRQAGVVSEPEDEQECQKGKQRARAHDRHAPADMIAEPAPYIRCDDLGCRRDRHELANLDGVEAK